MWEIPSKFELLAIIRIGVGRDTDISNVLSKPARVFSVAYLKGIAFLFPDILGRSWKILQLYKTKEGVKDTFCPFPIGDTKIRSQ